MKIPIDTIKNPKLKKFLKNEPKHRFIFCGNCGSLVGEKIKADKKTELPINMGCFFNCLECLEQACPKED